MKKKGLLIAAASAVMVLGAAMTAQAAGWTTENGAWVYEDESGYRVYNEWRRGADNLWRYLDDYGHMAVNCWVDEVYYVDANGIMLSGCWQQLYESPYGETDDVHWYYFQDNGKAVADAWKKINDKWYHFDPNCIMETGWVDEDMYYCGDDGAALTGWNRLYPPEDEYAYWGPFDDSDGMYWYYFNSSGKKFVPTDGGEYMEKRINGAYYCFDSNGIMQTGWVPFSGGGDISNYRFYLSDGRGVTGWYSAEPPAELYANYENDVEWFYFPKSAVPKVGSAELNTKDFVKINNKSFLFNANGNPVCGLQKVKIGDTEDYCMYYFDEEKRTAVTGKKEIDEGDGNVCTYYFSSNGRGYTGVYNNSLYYKGKLQMAENGLRYQAVNVNGQPYLVNESGRVTKSTSGVKDADGNKYITGTNGVIKTVNDAEEFSSYVRDPIEPMEQWYY